MKKTILFTLLCLLGFGAVTSAQELDPEIYAVLNGSTTTFYYDNKYMEREGASAYWDLDEDAPARLNFTDNTTKVVFDPSMDKALPVSTETWFYNFTLLEEIEDIKYLHTDATEDMSQMFFNCESLKSLDLSSFNTEKVEGMGAMFIQCKSLTSLDLTSFNTANVVNMAGMFEGCEKLQKIDLGSLFNTSNVKSMQEMFSGCTALKDIDLSSFNTSNVTDLAGMFMECTALENIDLSGFNTGNVTDMGSMFALCENVTSLDLRSFNINKVEDVSNMFYGCKELTTIYCNDNWNNYNVIEGNGTDVFADCKKLVGGNGTTFKPSMKDIEYARPDGGTSAPGFFTATPQVYTALEKDGFLYYYFDDQRTLKEGLTAVYDADDSEWLKGYIAQNTHYVVIDESMQNAGMTSMRYLFGYLDNLYEIEGLQNLNTAGVTDMHGMFADCQYIDALDLTTFNTDNVTDMAEMFSGCLLLPVLDLSSFDTENVTDMGSMFYHCTALESITFDDLNTANVTNMYCMFAECTALKNLDLSRFNTANVTNMFGMFLECAALEKIDLSSFNTASVTDMTGMFAECTALKELDLSRFNTANVKLMKMMFYDCEELTTIYCNDNWNTTVVEDSEDMFYGCLSLKGGKGTAYDDSKVDIEYARQDDPENSRPGYFTAVQTHKVTLVAENGTITVEEGVNLEAVPDGTTLHLTATPDENYEFAGWTNYDPETGLKVVSDITVTAEFKLNVTYRVTAVSADNALGEVTLTFDSEDIISKGEEANDFTVVPNAVGHLVATPKDKYTEFVRWNDEAEGFTLAERDITVTGDFDYIATFHKDSFNVVVTVEGIDPALVKVHGAGRYGRGDNATVSFTLNDDHYDFDMYLFDENNFRKTETLQFEEIDDHHDVRIVFKAKYYNVSATVIPAEAGIVKGPGDYEYGTDYTLTLEPAEGWELKEWRDGEALDEKSNVLTGYVYGEIHIECVLQKKEATALDAAEGTAGSAARKLLRNGILLIERNGKTYTAQGTALR